MMNGTALCEIKLPTMFIRKTIPLVTIMPSLNKKAHIAFVSDLCVYNEKENVILLMFSMFCSCFFFYNAQFQYNRSFNVIVVYMESGLFSQSLQELQTCVHKGLKKSQPESPQTLADLPAGQP